MKSSTLLRSMCIMGMMTAGTAMYAVAADDMPTMTPTTMPTMSDADFAKTAAQDHMAEIQMGHMAMDKSGNEQVKTFAQRMIDDHTKALEELKGIATAENMTLPSDVSDECKTMSDKLTGMSGTDFDKAYMDHMLAGHEKDYAAFTAESASGMDAQLKAYAAKYAPIVQQHLEAAKKIEGTAAGVSPSLRQQDRINTDQGMPH